ncbi:MAG: hypothetical protein A2Z25_16750 [Planctomycetes bacterium RBG_16_55_9]|nr:MAG: hypothetical protein A2Z25_16750 [Planctomycetes bacterium RBG_16_55_9]
MRKQAVFALSQAPAERGVDALIKTARSPADRGAQKEAIFWLGQTGDPRAVDTLAEMAKISK